MAAALQRMGRCTLVVSGEAATQHSNLHAQHEVLVVDDFDPTREAVVAVLEMKGLSARAAESGTEALSMLRGGFRPCVMLLDVRMPGLGGWEVWDRMRQDPELLTIPVVLLSADPADHIRARSVGIREFVEKPIDAAGLVEIVDRHCEHRPAVVL
jgi:CheY-like chemotaxis protein